VDESATGSVNIFKAGETMFPPPSPFFFVVHGSGLGFASRPAKPASGPQARRVLSVRCRGVAG
jgi:hypothetical protein